MQAVLIAAGRSSRFWPLANEIHKSQLFLLGKPLIYWTLKGLADQGIKEVVVVHGKDSPLPSMLDKENDLGLKLSYVLQKESQGTGNALWQAKDFIKEPFFVVWPNKVNSGELVQRILEKQKQGAEAVLVGDETETPWDYGVARMEGEEVAEIVENPEPGKEPSNIKILGFYFLQPDFFSYYQSLPKHHEADFIDTLNIYFKAKKVSLVKLTGDTPALKYPWELFGIMNILFSQQETKQIIAKTATIGKGTVIEGSVYIGEDCKIGPNNVLRGPLNLERDVKTGAFCEIKQSIVQEGTHFHSGYVGDSIVGKNCRFGSGFMTANRRLDRKTIKATIEEKKVDTKRTFFGAVMGNNVHFGIHTGTMPGVFIGSDCAIGPGTLVFNNLEDKSLFYVKHETSLKKRDEVG